MTEKTAATAAASADYENAKRRQRSERLTASCGPISVAPSRYVVGLGASFIPLGFGVLVGLLVWQLIQSGERRHSALAGAMALGGIFVWSTYNWPMIHRYIAG
jgi:hypothetical protein